MGPCFLVINDVEFSVRLSLGRHEGEDVRNPSVLRYSRFRIVPALRRQNCWPGVRNSTAAMSPQIGDLSNEVGGVGIY